MATRTIFGELIRTKLYSNDQNEHKIMLPILLTSREMGIFTSKGSENLSTGTPPMGTENEQQLVLLRIKEINLMFPLGYEKCWFLTGPQWKTMSSVARTGPD